MQRVLAALTRLSEDLDPLRVDRREVTSFLAALSALARLSEDLDFLRVDRKPFDESALKEPNSMPSQLATLRRPILFGCADAFAIRLLHSRMAAWVFSMLMAE